nr:hypothetical protein [Tanacetum cinerariifolium]
MARLAFCYYHNMIAILEKYDLNTDFHQIVDFVKASHLRYDLTCNPSVYVSHIQQFWSTAWIETTDEGTNILATVDGKLRTISESSIMRNLKLKDEAGISTLPDAELFENLTLMGYNILPNQKQYTRRTRIAQSSALPPVVDEPTSPIGDNCQGEACPTNSGLEAEQDRANIAKTSTLPCDSTPRVTFLAADEGSMQQQLNELTDLYTRLQRQQDEMASKLTAQDLEMSQLKARVKLLEDREGGGIAQSGEDAPIKGKSLDKGGVFVSISPVTKVYVVKVPTGSGSIPTASPPGTRVPTGGVPTGNDVVPTASPLFTTATMATPSKRRKGKEKMVESETPKKKKIQEQMDVQMARQLEEEMERDAEIARIHAKEELQIMIDGLDKNNETVANNLVKYQDNYAKVLKYQIQQRKPLSRKQQRDLYMSVLRSHSGWKAKHFKGMTLKEIKEKFDLVWKQIQDFIPIGSKEESERFKKKGIRLEQDSATKVKTLKEVPEEKLKEMMELILVEEHFDREDLNQLWALVKETLNIWQTANDKEKELWVELKRLYEPDVEDLLWTHTQNMMHDPVEWRLYDSYGVHHVLSKDQEIFMLVEKEYPLRKGLVILILGTTLLPPRKRFRDFISLKDSVEDDIDTVVLEDIETDATTIEVAVDRNVEAGIDVSDGMEVDVGIDAEEKVEDKVESSYRGTMKVRVDVVARIDIPDGILMINPSSTRLLGSYVSTRRVNLKVRVFEIGCLDSQRFDVLLTTQNYN